MFIEKCFCLCLLKSTFELQAFGALKGSRNGSEPQMTMFSSAFSCPHAFLLGFHLPQTLLCYLLNSSFKAHVRCQPCVTDGLLNSNSILGLCDSPPPPTPHTHHPPPSPTFCTPSWYLPGRCWHGFKVREHSVVCVVVCSEKTAHPVPALLSTRPSTSGVFSFSCWVRQESPGR